MSYISIPRLVFSGNFQADVSTVNNDVRHYDIAKFEPRFQDKPKGKTQNGWYNPDGTGNFRFFNLQISEALEAFGADPAKDPATGLYVSAQDERSACKIVDLDPQMQVVSTLFGLRIVLTDGTHIFMAGDYKPSAFRDITIGSRKVPGGSAVFTSVLTNLEWGKKAALSPTLVTLRAAAEKNEGKLSINLAPYNYVKSTRLGNLVGSIGAWTSGDAETFVSGRRLVSTGKPGYISNMNADVSGALISLDFSNAIPLGSDLAPTDIGDLYAGILRQPDSVQGLGTPEAKAGTDNLCGKTLAAGEIRLLGPIDYKPDTFVTTHGCIADLKLDPEAQALIADHPIALFTSNDGNSFEIILRETIGGLYTRADNFVNRMDPTNDAPATANVRFKVTQWGKPVGGVTVVTKELGTAVSNKYWGPGQKHATNPPTASYPTINTPPDKAQITSQMTSGADGWADCPISVDNPGNPRGYVDGQIYTASYQIAVANASPQAMFDLIVIHARQAKVFDNPPKWEDIAPVMQQYDNLYPIMSRHMFSLATPEVLQKHATLLTLAFSRPIDDSNHMPATRDLSTSKRQAILNYLAQYTHKPAPKAIPPQQNVDVTVKSSDTSHLPEPAPILIEQLEEMLSHVQNDDTGKNPVLRNYLMAEIRHLKLGEPV